MALIHNLIEFFSTFTVIPIDPDDVKAQIIEYGVKDEIYFVGVTLDERILRGSLIHYYKTPGVYSEPIICADIYYDRNQQRRWRRVICCKELLHILDHSVSRTATRESCEKLIDDFVAIVNDGASAYSDEKLHAWTDTLTLYYAVSVLFPAEVRDEIHPLFADGKLSISEIADKADLPEELVRLVMSDGWPGLYDVILRRK